MKIAKKLDKDNICKNCLMNKHSECLIKFKRYRETAFGDKAFYVNCRCLCREFNYSLIEHLEQGQVER